MLHFAAHRPYDSPLFSSHIAHALISIRKSPIYIKERCDYVRLECLYVLWRSVDILLIFLLNVSDQQFGNPTDA
jgi:hypothetical protein